MPHKEIKKSLGKLRTELEETPAQTALLEKKLEDAEQGIDRYTPEAVQHLVESLQHAAEEVEVDHPQITSLINQVMTALSHLGI